MTENKSDLISRNALKTALTRDKFVFVCLSRVLEEIDNAPTVALPFECCGDTCKIVRPQGEFSLKELEGWLTSCGYASGTVEDKVKEFERYIERSRENE